MGSTGSKTLRPDWMEQLPPHLRHYPLHKLAIPGSHESGTYELSPHKGLAPDFPAEGRSPFLKAILGSFCVSHLVTKKWSRCQDMSFAEQLTAGIRFFDLRVGKRDVMEEKSERDVRRESVVIEAKPESDVRQNSDVMGEKAESGVIHKSDVMEERAIRNVIGEKSQSDVTNKSDVMDEKSESDVRSRNDVEEGCKCDDETKSQRGRKEEEESLHFVHGLYGPTVRECLDDVRAFLDEHQHEVVLLEFHRFHNLSDSDHELLAGMLNEAFNDLICRYSPGRSCGELTLNGLCQAGTRVVVFYYDWGRADRGRPAACEHFWPYAAIASQTSWANTMSLAEWTKTQHTERSYRHDTISDRPPAFYVCQGVLTPDGVGRAILNSLCCTLFCCGRRGTLKTECGGLINPVLADWMREDAEGPSPRRCVIYTADFVGEEYSGEGGRGEGVGEGRSFVQSVIDLNLLLDEDTG